MDPMTRRKMIRLIPGAAATSGLVAGAAFLPDPATVEQSPWVRARCLARELSRVLAECDGGSQLAIVHPAGSPDAVFFGDRQGHADEAEVNRFARRFHRMICEGQEEERAQFHARELDQVFTEHFHDTRHPWKASWHSLAGHYWRPRQGWPSV